LRQGLGTSALAAIVVAIVSFAADASPLMTGRSPSEPFASRISLLHQVVIYAKEGSRKLVDGRWNLSQSESKLGIKLSTGEKNQLMACTGKIVCEEHGREVFASAVSVLRPDLLVTAKHVFSGGRRSAVSFKWCSFRSYLHRNVPIPVSVEKDQRKGYFLNNEDFIVVRLKRGLRGCDSFAVSHSDSTLSEGKQVFSASAYQSHTWNKISSREPVLAKGTIRSVSKGLFGGPPFYYADIDLDVGGSGGGVFALKDGRPVTDDEGRLILRGLLVAIGPHARNGRPYSEDQNYTVIIGLQTVFRDLVKGKANRLTFVEQAPCLQGGEPEITVISESIPSAPSETLAAFLQKGGCSRKAGEANTDCIAEELKELAKGIQTLTPSSRTKEKYQFKLKNDTSCPICFTYDRCNDYGCWDQVVRARGKSTLFAGVRKQAPVIKNPQFCKSGRLLADVRPSFPPRKPGPPLPPRKPEQTPMIAAESREYVESEARFLAVKEKAERVGVGRLTAEDILGLSLGQIRELRGY
jgi:hypothetical protein